MSGFDEPSTFTEGRLMIPAAAMPFVRALPESELAGREMVEFREEAGVGVIEAMATHGEFPELEQSLVAIGIPFRRFAEREFAQHEVRVFIPGECDLRFQANDDGEVILPLSEALQHLDQGGEAALAAWVRGTGHASGIELAAFNGRIDEAELYRRACAALPLFGFREELRRRWPEAGEQKLAIATSCFAELTGRGIADPFLRSVRGQVTMQRAVGQGPTAGEWTPEAAGRYLLDAEGPLFGPLDAAHLALWHEGSCTDDDTHDRRLLARMAAGSDGRILH